MSDVKKKSAFDGFNVIPVSKEQSAAIVYPSKEVVYVNSVTYPVAYISFGVAITLLVIYFMKKLQTK